MKTNKADYIGLWDYCLEIIRDNITKEAYNTWFAPIVPLSYQEGKLTVQVPSRFYIEFLEDKYLDIIKSTIYKVFGEGTTLSYTIQVAGTPIEYPVSEGKQPRKLVEEKDVPNAPVAELDAHLNPSYIFETFIEGSSNKLSRSVGEAVAQNPGKTIFNPLFIFGPSGVGKTHLANAIGAKIKELYPEKRVLYVSAHLFQVQYTDSVRNNTTNDFVNFYQTIDTLIIDDIQEFAGATRTQNTFFYIFNQLHLNGKQLIMTSDRSPVLLQGMEERLITRFKWGMVAELEKPSLDLRKDILRYKTKRDGVKFSDEIIDYIAENVSDSVRDLEGIVASLLAYSTIYNKEVDMDLTEKTIRKFINFEAKPITVEHIVQTVCEHLDIDASVVQSKSRKRDAVLARQISMFFAKKFTDLSNAKIGAQIGNKDHATVIHACKLVQDMQEIDKKFKDSLSAIQADLRKR
ncbi:MAG: chromosomal replication initiator protein DnaA [Bacteroidales bacterium]|nr:chromosomal replication initiator protein DnaA [Bacteroidaceae bacterium]MDO4187002.1 chromosomal replication initiator protein DnaA [Bacteroidales bacterium]MBQ9885147.1 chromosomal replication initiator protein DnaA [Bacteroidaceae bacterium]MBR1940076.1 chromosomal replication initiator protein DnaA [Bacteroidaceae bacterium]MBR3014047.1 chromosomal replication initiator protein DnaA [Bacteroidaceae bacterium]